VNTWFDYSEHSTVQCNRFCSRLSEEGKNILQCDIIDLRAPTAWLHISRPNMGIIVCAQKSRVEMSQPLLPLPGPPTSYSVVPPPSSPDLELRMGGWISTRPTGVLSHGMPTQQAMGTASPLSLLWAWLSPSSLPRGHGGLTSRVEGHLLLRSLGPYV